MLKNWSNKWNKHIENGKLIFFISERTDKIIYEVDAHCQKQCPLYYVAAEIIRFVLKCD